MDKYLKELMNEYVSARGTFEEDKFLAWIFNKEKILKSYYQLLILNGLDLKKQTVEIDSGRFDTLGLVIPKRTKIITIGNNADTIELRNVHSYKGRIRFNNTKPVILNEDNKIIKTRDDLRDTKNYIFDENTDINLIDELLNINDINLYIGSYGNTSDINIKEKIDKLSKIKEEISSHPQCSLEETKITIINDQLSMIKVKTKKLKN